MISYLTAHKGSWRNLRRCILSVQADHKNSGIEFEHIVWMDGAVNPSEDAKHHMVLQDQFPDTLFIVNAMTNMGKSHAMNRLIDLAQGNILSFLDSDDWVLLGRSSRILSAFSEKDANCFGSIFFTGDRGLKQVYQATYPLDDASIRTQFIFYPYLLFSSIALRRQILDDRCDLRFDERLRAGLDYEFYSRLLQATHVRNINQPLVYYTQNPKGITHTAGSRIEQLHVHAKVVKNLLVSYIGDLDATSCLVEVLMTSISKNYKPVRSVDMPSLLDAIAALKNTFATGSTKPNSLLSLVHQDALINLGNEISKRVIGAVS